MATRPLPQRRANTVLVMQPDHRSGHGRRDPFAGPLHHLGAHGLRSGPAIVRLRDGRTYVGHAICDGWAVTMKAARLWHRDLLGERLYTARDFTWPIGELRKIEWREAPGL